MSDAFKFISYRFDSTSKQLKLNYGYAELAFTETYRFDFDFVDYDVDTLDAAIQQLFFMAGVSYYKLYMPGDISIKAGSIDDQLAQFLNNTYQRGLGELLYVNGLYPRMDIRFPTNTAKLVTRENLHASGTLIGIGGGKDSLVSVELMRGHIDKLATWSVGHRPQLTPLIQRLGLPHYWVERVLDSQLTELNTHSDTFNGHIPISAIFATLGTVVAILAGYKDIVVSNEQSANEPTLHYQGIAINHQYSKSQTFESEYQALLQASFAKSVQYYSFLRPLSELYICEIFSKIGFDTYKDVFSSCNKAYTRASDHMFWDGKCPKCAFIFLAFTPFIERGRLETLFHGKNLLLDAGLRQTYLQLLGIDGDKPLECVGEIKESRMAMRLAQRIYPELIYDFEVPDDYDYTALYTHHMPDSAFEILRAGLQRF